MVGPINSQELSAILAAISDRLNDCPAGDAGDPMRLRKDVEAAADALIKVYGAQSIDAALAPAQRVEQSDRTVFSRLVRVEIERRIRDAARQADGA